MDTHTSRYLIHVQVNENKNIGQTKSCDQQSQRRYRDQHRNTRPPGAVTEDLCYSDTFALLIVCLFHTKHESIFEVKRVT